MASALAGAGVICPSEKTAAGEAPGPTKKSPAEPGRAMTAGLIGAPGLGGKNRRTRQSNTTNAGLLARRSAAQARALIEQVFRWKVAEAKVLPPGDLLFAAVPVETMGKNPSRVLVGCPV